ncbi:hypothetical protein [Limnofasciculus baicalensis]|uniref:Uncharacterized protein n=1 Tax=Limnofasciculus baicalensis BBK-W-15 TaxID=2699891 RepID=A0AAE3KT13_9CYAN|nr:hypothetical protein [Limnofasciculus baicalensis]MCP2730037.1 hypothetical protein [Limnofasciculus baicalensis BBK-W-15]
MKKSLLTQFLLTPIFILAAVFLAGITPPIGTSNTKSATSQVLNLTIFLLNLEMGVSFAAVMGWRISSLKSVEIEAQCMNHQAKIKQKDVEIEAALKSLQNQISTN